jgi:hypothetical protein
MKPTLQIPPGFVAETLAVLSRYLGSTDLPYTRILDRFGLGRILSECHAVLLSAEGSRQDRSSGVGRS